MFVFIRQEKLSFFEHKKEIKENERKGRRILIYAKSQRHLNPERARGRRNEPSRQGGTLGRGGECGKIRAQRPSV